MGAAASGTGVALTALGRHALALVARDLRLRGTRVLVGPDYHCLSMFLPFQLEGIAVRTAATGPDTLFRPDALLAALRDRPRAAVLHSVTHGRAPEPGLLTALAAARAAGHPLTVDETHAVLDPPTIPADYRVASLRKLLPLTDGAYAVGLHESPVLPRRATDDLFTTLRASGLRGGRAPEALARAEDLADESWEPAAISAAARETLLRLDVAALARRRRHNAARLQAALPDVTVAATACCVVVSHPDAERAARVLAAAGVVAPVQWDRPPGHPRDRPWRTDLLTLPVDPELDDDALQRIVALVRGAFAAGGRECAGQGSSRRSPTAPAISTAARNSSGVTRRSISG